MPRGGGAKGVSIFRKIISKGGNTSQAEDCFQEAVISLIKKVRKGEFKEGSEVRNYVFMVARNQWYTTVKKIKQREEELGTKDGVVDGESSVFENEKKSIIYEVFAQLGERCKDLLHLYIYENKKMGEIKELLGMKSEKVVKMTKYRCKEKMIAYLKANPEYQQIIKS